MLQYLKSNRKLRQQIDYTQAIEARYQELPLKKLSELASQVPKGKEKDLLNLDRHHLVRIEGTEI